MDTPEKIAGEMREFLDSDSSLDGVTYRNLFAFADRLLALEQQAGDVSERTDALVRSLCAEAEPSLAAAHVPSGMVTKAMAKAGRDAMYSGAWTSDEDEAEAIYRAMIAASEAGK